MVSSVLDLGLGSHHGQDCEVLCPSDWLGLVCHLLVATLRGILRSEAFNPQLEFPLLMDDKWELTPKLTRPTTERAALTVLVQQFTELVAPEGLGKSIIDYYEATCHKLVQEIERVRSDALQALHSELKSDPKVNTHTWDTVVARLTQECYDMAQTQMEDLQKVFLSALQAKLADQLAPLPHANCNKIIVTCSGIIYSTIASRIESTMDDTIQTHHASLLHKAYDQAHANVELQYPTIVQDVLTETCNSVLQTEQDQVQATTVEAQNLVQAEFDQWRHDELHTRQAEALARLARWEQDRQEEQLSNFHCTWDMFPLHAICSLSMPFDLHSTPGLLNMASILCQSQPCLRQFPCPSTLTPSHRWT